MTHITKMRIPSADEPVVDNILSQFDDDDFDYKIIQLEQTDKSLVYMESGTEDTAYQRGSWMKSKLDDSDDTTWGDTTTYGYKVQTDTSLDDIQGA